jgi:hypothetical protein
MKCIIKPDRTMLALCLLVISFGLQEAKAQRSGFPHEDREQQVTTEYLPDKNMTVVMLRKMAFNNPCSPLLVAEFSYEGRTPQPAESVKFGFIENYFTDKELIIVADDETFHLGKLALMRFHQGNACRPLIRSVGLVVERDKFLKIVRASKLQVRVEDHLLPFNNEHIEALREFARILAK